MEVHEKNAEPQVVDEKDEQPLVEADGKDEEPQVTPRRRMKSHSKEPFGVWSVQAKLWDVGASRGKHLGRNGLQT